jgi:hypothetical protein
MFPTARDFYRNLQVVMLGCMNNKHQDKCLQGTQQKKGCIFLDGDFNFKQKSFLSVLYLLFGN